MTHRTDGYGNCDRIGRAIREFVKQNGMSHHDSVRLNIGKASDGEACAIIYAAADMPAKGADGLCWANERIEA